MNKDSKSIFDPESSKAMNSLKGLCSELVEEDIVGREIGYSTSCEYKGRKLYIYFESLPDTFERTLALGKPCLENIAQYEVKAKQVVCAQYLDLYNETWKDDERSDMTPEEFINNLHLVGISFHFGTNVCMDFEESGMFCCHQLMGASVDGGRTFTDAEM